MEAFLRNSREKSGTFFWLGQRSVREARTVSLAVRPLPPPAPPTYLFAWETVTVPALVSENNLLPCAAYALPWEYRITHPMLTLWQ
jgi:hypothetical protein